MNDSICTCGADCITDYPTCPSCAARKHFTHRECRCASCARPVIEIAPSQRGTWDFKAPFMSTAFLDELYLRVGKPFRFWNVRAEMWEIRPVDHGMIELVARLLAKHFTAYSVTIAPAPASEEKEAA